MAPSYAKEQPEPAAAAELRQAIRAAKREYRTRYQELQQAASQVAMGVNVIVMPPVYFISDSPYKINRAA